MKGGKKELVSEPPVSNNNRHFGKSDNQIDDSNDTDYNNSQGSAQSNNLSTHSSTHHDNNLTISDIHTNGDYSHNTSNTNFTIGE